MRSSNARTLGLIALATLVVALIAPFVGPIEISFEDLLSPPSESPAARIFWTIRVPRVLMALLAGAALATSGVAYQSMFRNELATPFTLGTSSGASLGAALAVRLGASGSVLGASVKQLGLSAITLAAFLGAVASIALVYGLTYARRGFSSAVMLLAGVAVSFFFSSLILFVQYTSDFHDSFLILRWLMGGLGRVDTDSLLTVTPLVAVGAAIVFVLRPELDLLTTGDDIAASRGVAVERTRKLVFLATSLMVGGIVAMCGPIGFVGLMAPHITRLLVGPHHRTLVPASFLVGGGFLLVCDTLARTIFAPAELPVGILTAFLGGPFFLWLLMRERGPRAFT